MINIDKVFHSEPPIAASLQQLEEIRDNSLTMVFKNKREIKRFGKHLNRFLTQDVSGGIYKSYVSEKRNESHQIFNQYSELDNKPLYHYNSAACINIQAIANLGKTADMYIYEDFLIGFFDAFEPAKEMIVLFEDQTKLGRFKEMIRILGYTNLVFGPWSMSYYAKDKDLLGYPFLSSDSRTKDTEIFIDQQFFIEPLRSIFCDLDAPNYTYDMHYPNRLRVYLDNAYSDEDNLKNMLEQLYGEDRSAYLVYHGVLAHYRKTNYLLFREIFEFDEDYTFAPPIRDSFVLKQENIIEYVCRYYDKVIVDDTILVTPESIVYLYDSGVDIHFKTLADKQAYIQNFIGNNELIDLNV